MTERTWGSTRSRASAGSRNIATTLVIVLLLTVLATNVLSAYMRHREAGLGCAPWPACYGEIESASAEQTRPQPVATALNPDQVIKRVHRIVAGVLVVLVLLVLHRCNQVRDLDAFECTLPYAIAAITLLLAIVGPASYLKTRPAIATANLLGGLLMLAVTWRLLLALRPFAPAGVSARRVLRTLTAGVLAVVALQVALGAWTSANFAGAVCAEMLACRAPAVETADAGAFWYFRELATDPTGRIVGDANTWLIHHAHRAGAWIATTATVALALVLFVQGLTRRDAVLLIGLASAQLAIGLVAVTSQLPLVVVLGHNFIAALLVLTLITIHHRLRPR